MNLHRSHSTHWLPVLLTLALLGIRPEAQTQGPMTYPNKECLGLVSHGIAPLCDGTACSPLGPYCWDPCTVLTYTGGDCVATAETACVREKKNVDEKTCRDCSCTTFGIGNCSSDNGTYPSGTKKVWGCNQG